MLHELTYSQIKEILRIEYKIDLVPVQIFIGSNNLQPKKYTLLNEDCTLAYPHEVTLETLREYLTSKGYSSNYE